MFVHHCGFPEYVFKSQGLYSVIFTPFRGLSATCSRCSILKALWNKILHVNSVDRTAYCFGHCLIFLALLYATCHFYGIVANVISSIENAYIISQHYYNKYFICVALLRNIL